MGDQRLSGPGISGPIVSCSWYVAVICVQVCCSAANAPELQCRNYGVLRYTTGFMVL